MSQQFNDRESILLTRRQAAELLGLSAQTLAVWSMTGRHLPVVKIGRVCRYRREDLDRFIEEGTIPASSGLKTAGRQRDNK